ALRPAGRLATSATRVSRPAARCDSARSSMTRRGNSATRSFRRWALPVRRCSEAFPSPTAARGCWEANRCSTRFHFTRRISRPLPAGTVALNGAAIASMPLVYRPGTRLTVTIAVTPDSNVVAHAVEDQPPAGLSVGVISDGGFLDVARGKVKWGPFADGQSRALSYEVTPPAGATNLVGFNGTAAF